MYNQINYANHSHAKKIYFSMERYMSIGLERWLYLSCPLIYLLGLTWDVLFVNYTLCEISWANNSAQPRLVCLIGSGTFKVYYSIRILIYAQLWPYVMKTSWPWPYMRQLMYCTARVKKDVICQTTWEVNTWITSHRANFLSLHVSLAKQFKAKRFPKYVILSLWRLSLGEIYFPLILFSSKKCKQRKWKHLDKDIHIWLWLFYFVAILTSTTLNRVAPPWNDGPCVFWQTKFWLTCQTANMAQLKHQEPLTCVLVFTRKTSWRYL